MAKRKILIPAGYGKKALRAYESPEDDGQLNRPLFALSDTTKRLNSLVHDAGIESFAIARGLYWYCLKNHGGQFSPEYKVLSQLQELYTPSANEHGTSSEDRSKGVERQLMKGDLDIDDVLAFIKRRS